MLNRHEARAKVSEGSLRPCVASRGSRDLPSTGELTGRVEGFDEHEPRFPVGVDLRRAIAGLGELAEHSLGVGERPRGRSRLRASRRDEQVEHRTGRRKLGRAARELERLLRVADRREDVASRHVKPNGARRIRIGQIRCHRPKHPRAVEVPPVGERQTTLELRTVEPKRAVARACRRQRGAPRTAAMSRMSKAARAAASERASRERAGRGELGRSGEQPRTLCSSRAVRRERLELVREPGVRSARREGEVACPVSAGRQRRGKTRVHEPPLRAPRSGQHERAQ